MASQVEIVNRALLKLGAQPIMDMLDASKQARTMTAIYDTVRKAEIRKRLWAFALRRTQLPALSEVPSWGFARAFQVPSDNLRLVQIGDVFVAPSLQDYRQGDDAAWSIEDGKICTDFGDPLKIRYLANVTDPGVFDACFVDALAAKLAYEGCEAITQSNSKKAEAMDDYRMAVKEAALAGAVEKAPSGWPDDSWMLGRL